MHRLLICPPDASSPAMLRHVQGVYSRSTSARSILEGIVSSHLGLRMRIFVRRSFRKSKPDNRTEETLLIEFCIMDLGLLFLLRILLSYTLFLKH